MCMIDAYESYGDVNFGSQLRKARKEHECDECRRTIEAGEHYHVGTGVSDGAMWRAKQCEHCRAASSWLSEVCGGWVFEGLGEDLREHWREDARHHSMWLGRTIVGMGNMWRSKRTDSLLPVPRIFTADEAKAMLANMVAD